MNIRPATESEAPILSDLVMRAKSHWGYSSEALERWRPELAVSPTHVRERPTFVAMAGAEIVGFYSLRTSGTAWELDNLWVLPRFMHQGIGRALLAHALATAARGGASEVTVDADPNAESFYLECGAVRRGDVPAPIPGQPKRVRPQLAFVTPLPTSIKGVLLVEGGVVLVKNPRDEWELPGGRVEPGESPERTLAREFEEELSIQVHVGAPIDSYVFEVVPERNVRIVTFGCILAGAFAPRISAEHSEFCVCPVSELDSLSLPRGYRQSIERWSSAV